MSANPTLASDIKIYPEQFHGALNERLQQQLGMFNAASGGAIQLTSRGIRGDYEYESFFKNMGASAVSRRDTTSTSAFTATKLTADEQVGVKLNRKYAFESTYDAMKKRLPTEDAQKIFSMVAGEQVADFIQADYLNSGLMALNSALSGVSALNVYASGATADGRFTHDVLAQGLATHGDQSGHLGVIVTHSLPYFGLVRQTIADKLLEATAFTIVTGTPQTLNRRVIITDSSSLIHQAAGAVKGTLTFASGNKIQGTGVGTGAVVGGYVLVASATTAANNGYKRIATVTSANEIITVETIAAEAGGSATSTLQATYNTLLLQGGAVEVAESETPTVIGMPVQGYENLYYRIQGEHAFNLRVLGYRWDVTSGAANPDATALALNTNWDKCFTDNKQLAGARVISMA